MLGCDSFMHNTYMPNQDPFEWTAVDENACSSTFPTLSWTFQTWEWCQIILGSSPPTSSVGWYVGPEYHVTNWYLVTCKLFANTYTQDKLHILHHLPFSWCNYILGKITMVWECKEVIDGLSSLSVSNMKKKHNHETYWLQHLKPIEHVVNQVPVCANISQQLHLVDSDDIVTMFKPPFCISICDNIIKCVRYIIYLSIIVHGP